ncbi:ATP-binding cassette domain-containing protein [Streptomyces olivaceus]|uniref:ATP-binding cassette domain-containing protein n=1 Tax=Streptomyces olivaceus TaxID=47716 RepID=A0ABS7W6N1_STROV|nr:MULTISPECIES: ATP-binding cassette domain-containing protein [Streptomyces]MBZ6090619.1 ATP-binding cassette domain-containing protein [Streptomyces olivaceus]MBZ6096795.1 ATP-binding cassette domain-containing protein [Streptomyces olivaceus]MBZ6117555.1 ATP-binding cassette domain-containing protein [Streptomyces olivaceus]MBZ6152965.1 ATP-binding cassette domain-containing protein [Streptomyces olivaceus]MBZ6193847.1 ATP-binding cassette domain-containing protein [Streptomyces olivaceus]
MSAPGSTAIRTRGLRRVYGGTVAVHGLDLTVAAGEKFGFLGPNGAGKSTTIGMLSTLLRPSGGRAAVAGADVAHRPDEVRRRIGVVFQDPSTDRELTGWQNLYFHGRLHGMPRREVRARARSLLDLVGLADRGDAPVGSYSGGMRRRLEVARALMHRPRVLFLDEPTTGLDPQSRSQVWQKLHELGRRDGVTVFLTTHYLEEAENCDRIAVMDHGRLVAQGTPHALKSAIGADVVHLRTDDDRSTARSIRERFGLDAEATPEGVRVGAADGAGWVPRLCAHLTTGVTSVTVTRPSLDDVFLHHTGRSLRNP